MYLRILGKPATGSRIWVFPHRGYRIMSGTVKDNILFSHDYDDTFYNLVLDGERHYPRRPAP